MSKARRERRGTDGLLRQFCGPTGPYADTGQGRGVYWQTADLNARALEIYRNEILTLAMNRYRWVNLPASVDAEYLEFMLAVRGQASLAFPSHAPGVFLATDFTLRGDKLTPYMRPVEWVALTQGAGTRNRRFDASYRSGTIVYDSETRFPVWQIIEAYAQELADIYVTKRVNLFHQRIPLVMKVPQDKVLDATNIAKQIGGGEPMIIGVDSIDDVEVAAITQKPAPYIGKDLIDAERAVWARIYDALGIPNVIFKAERQITTEVEAQQEETSIIRLSGLRERRKAADELNRRFYEPNLVYPKLLEKPIQVVKSEDVESFNWNALHTVDDSEAEESEASHG